jgi:hypothetical protein
MVVHSTLVQAVAVEPADIQAPEVKAVRVGFISMMVIILVLIIIQVGIKVQ